MKRKPEPSEEAPPRPLAASRRSVLLVDDHPVMRSGLTQLINRQPDLEVVAEAGNPAEAWTVLERRLPDLMVSDITMPGRSGLDFIKDILARFPSLRILVLSMHDEAIYSERALRSGARGYIMKEAGGESLLEAIRCVLRGEVYLSAAQSARVLNGLSERRPRGSDSPIGELTDREFEIFRLIGQGKGTRDIAEQLHLSSKTVDVHRGHIKEKLQLKDVTALIRFAVRWTESPGGDPSP